MRGFPPPQGLRVTSDNWLLGPHNRWGFLHVRELARTARIARGDGPVAELEADPRDLGAIPVRVEGSTLRLSEALERTYTDAICVVHEGRVVFERYVEGMDPADTHLLMSVSKSLTGALVGILVGEGVLDPGAAVPDAIPALRGSAWEGCTLQHLLDMRSGTRFDEEDYENPDSDGVLIEEISGYRTRRRPDLPADTYAWIAALENDGPHGGRFRYRSILTDVLAWAATVATGTRFPELFSRALWSRIGAERDAEIIVDAAGFPVAEGGICTTLRDLARFGVMHLQDGEIAGRQVVPADWIGRLLHRDAELIGAFDPELLLGRPHACYHDQWWIWDGAAGVYSAYGINGQQLLIHRPSQTVIARMSTWPAAWPERLVVHAEAATVAVLEHLAG